MYINNVLYCFYSSDTEAFEACFRLLHDDDEISDKDMVNIQQEATHRCYFGLLQNLCIVRMFSNTFCSERLLFGRINSRKLNPFGHFATYQDFDRDNFLIIYGIKVATRGKTVAKRCKGLTGFSMPQLFQLYQTNERGVSQFCLFNLFAILYAWWRVLYFRPEVTKIVNSVI